MSWGRKREEIHVHVLVHVFDYAHMYVQYVTTLRECVQLCGGWLSWEMHSAGAPNIGRRSLKTRLLNEYPSRFAEVKARKLCSCTLLMSTYNVHVHVPPLNLAHKYMFMFVCSHTYMNNHVHSAPRPKKEESREEERRTTHTKMHNSLNGLEKYV